MVAILRQRRAKGPLPRRLPPSGHFNAPLHSLGAFAVATAIVVSGASASVAGVMAYLDVRNTTEFAARMRTWVSHSMPLLTAKIYRRDIATPQHRTPTTYDHDATEQRLAAAFDGGGFDAWAEAAASELEAEAEVERARKRTTS